MTKSGAKLFYANLKENPDEIIAWAEREIAEYQKLIKLIKEKSNDTPKSH